MTTVRTRRVPGVLLWLELGSRTYHATARVRDDEWYWRVAISRRWPFIHTCRIPRRITTTPEKDGSP